MSTSKKPKTTLKIQAINTLLKKTENGFSEDSLQSIEANKGYPARKNEIRKIIFKMRQALNGIDPAKNVQVKTLHNAFIDTIISTGFPFLENFAEISF